MSHKKKSKVNVKSYRTCCRVQEDCPVVHTHWNHLYDRDNFDEAERYLSLIMSSPDAKAYRKKLWEFRYQVAHYTSAELLRASGLNLLPFDDRTITENFSKIQEDGEEFSPVLLIRGNYQRPLYVAYGYHSICTSHYIEETTMIPAIVL